MTTERLENTVAQSLMAVGLYTIAFEATALSFRARVDRYIRANEPDRLNAFDSACNTAFATFRFCGPILVRHGALTQEDVDGLEEIRQRRNLFAHEGYNRVFDLTVAEVLPDVQKLHRITAKVERWLVPMPCPPPHTSGATAPTSRTVQFRVSPAFFGFVAKLVEQMSMDKLRIDLQRTGD